MSDRIEVYGNEKKGTLTIRGIEEVVEAKIESDASVTRATKADVTASNAVHDSVWSILRGLSEGKVPSINLKEFLGWKRTNLQLLGRERERVISITVPSPASGGNFKMIDDVVLLGQIADSEKHNALLGKTVVLPTGPTTPEITLRGSLGIWLLQHLSGWLAPLAKEGEITVTLSGDLAKKFKDEFISAGDSSKVHPNHESLTITEPAKEQTRFTIRGDAFATIMEMSAGGDRLARQLLASGYKKFLWKIGTGE